MEVKQCLTHQEFVIAFKGQTQPDYLEQGEITQVQGDALLTISVMDLMPALKFDVVLFKMPQNPNVGQEVTVNFHAPGIKNKGVFYTDSNGLEMQERTLNYRPTWNLTIKDGGLNVTANYYPINSAIAVQDLQTKMQMVVMNDRAQGGSVLKDGRIEFMQNRRSTKDDSRGVDEPIDENITVGATYYLQYFNTATRTPLQRVIQQITDSPQQQFFTFNSS